MPIFIPIFKQSSKISQITITNNDSDLDGTYVRSDLEYFKRVGVIDGAWEVEDDTDPNRAVTFQPYFYNTQNNVSIVHAEGTSDWKFLKGNWSDSQFTGGVGVVNLLYSSDSETDFSSTFGADSDGYNPGISLNESVGGGNASFASQEFEPERITKLFANDNGVVRNIRKLWVLHDNAPRLIFRGIGVGTPSYFPLRNTSVDPTFRWWKENNPGYVFVPNDGIYTLGPMTNAFGMFYLAYDGFNDPDIALWDVSNITNMSYMFAGATSFNQNISSWDVSNVTDMNHMFTGSHDFNQPLNNWDVSNVTDMASMFSSADNFNQPLNNWDVSNVTTMAYMFNGTDEFDQDISGWDVSNVTTMERMFQGSLNFNEDISGWDVDAVTYAIDFSENANQKGTGAGNWTEAEHPSNTALGNFYNLDV